MTSPGDTGLLSAAAGAGQGPQECEASLVDSGLGRGRAQWYCRWEGAAGGTAGGSDAPRGLLSDFLVETRQAGGLKPGDGSELQKHLQETRGRLDVSPGTLTFKQGNPVLADTVRDQGSVQLVGFSAAGTSGRRDTTAHGGRIQQTLPLA